MKAIIKILLFSVLLFVFAFSFDEASAQTWFGFDPVSNADSGIGGSPAANSFSGQWVNIPSSGNLGSVVFRAPAAQAAGTGNVKFIVADVDGIIVSSTVSGLTAAAGEEYEISFGTGFTITPGWYFIGVHYNSGVGVVQSYSNAPFSSTTVWETNENACIVQDFYVTATTTGSFTYPTGCDGYVSGLYRDGNDIYFKITGTGFDPLDGLFAPSAIFAPVFSTDEPTSPWYVDCSSYDGAGWFSSSTIPGFICGLKKAALSVGQSLFQPRTDIGARYEALSLTNKFPFAYWYDVKEIFDGTASTSAVVFPSVGLSFASFDGSATTTLVAFSSSTITQYVGSSLINTFRTFLNVVLYVGFAMYVYVKGKGLFG